MTNKTTAAYQDVFKFVEEKLFMLEPTLTMTDYEDGLRTAIKNHWPNCEIRGCEFHFKQAVQRKCKVLPKIRRLLKKSFYSRKIKNMLMSIALLPENKIKDGYKYVQNYAKEKKLDAEFTELFSYFERQWLRGVRIIFHSVCVAIDDVYI